MSCLPPLSLYLHLPWCVRKCPYCDFNSHPAGDSPPRDRYVAALLADLAAEAAQVVHSGRPIQTVFIGGGTPSLFAGEEIQRVLDGIRQQLVLASDAEITMEANPGSVERGNLRAYREAGVNRLSLGAQSFDDETLVRLGRVHNAAEIGEAFNDARSAGFDNINLDLMFALPGQNLATAKLDIDSATGLQPEHISYYQLTLEPNTVFYARPPADLPDDDLAWEIQDYGHGLLRDRGYLQYEVSAFAQPGRSSRHNLNYWLFGDYLAIGAGAHGKLTGPDGSIRRYRKPSHPETYIEQSIRGELQTSPVVVGGDDTMFEYMLNALRLTDGFSDAAFVERTGLPATQLDAVIDGAVVDGLLERVPPGDGDEATPLPQPGQRAAVRRWRPTALGFRFLNDLQGRFLPD